MKKSNICNGAIEEIKGNKEEIKCINKIKQYKKLLTDSKHFQQQFMMPFN